MQYDDDIVYWMTVKGTHVPIRKGQSREQAMIAFLSEIEDEDPFKDRTKNNEHNSGAKSGALDSKNKDFDRANKHADMMYETYRNVHSDVPKIAKLTGYSEQQIVEIKKYLFDNPEFSPDFDQAQSWDRLRKGIPRNADLILVSHEIMEMELREQGLSYDEAHKKTNRVFNYEKALKEEEQ